MFHLVAVGIVGSLVAGILDGIVVSEVGDIMAGIVVDVVGGTLAGIVGGIVVNVMVGKDYGLGNDELNEVVISNQSLTL